MEVADLFPEYGLDYLGLEQLGMVYWNIPTPALYSQAVRRYEALISHLGPLVVSTGVHTGRSPRDRYIVDEASSTNDVWWHQGNAGLCEESFDAILSYMRKHLYGKALFAQDLHVGADPRYRLGVRVLSTLAWASLFARNMFIRQPLDSKAYRTFKPDFTVLHCPNLHVDPDVHKTRSGTFIGIHLRRKLILICGSHYGGEIKKSIFSSLNFIYPAMAVLPMHCSANVSKQDTGDVAIFFGLSGTGKTTLSSDPERLLIGDDEHGWSDNGVFSFEGGCYAKVIRLSAEAEPDIYQCTRRFGTILENVVMNPATRRIDLDDASITENTRASYPISHVPNALRDGLAGHPRNVIMLTCDAFGVLPPIARLTPAQAMYHFISGYTAKVAGTEVGITEPQATFSTCFGAPFMLRHPSVYATMLADRLKKHGAHCWLVNTGWSGGPYGEGQRMKIQLTRALIKAALDGSLAAAEMRTDPIFGFEVPQSAPGVPPEVLNPKQTWRYPERYDDKARHLAQLFVNNFKQFEAETPAEVKAAGPKAV